MSFVKHLLDSSSSLLVSLRAPLNLQVLSVSNKATAVDMKVDLLTIRVDQLESAADLSCAIFAEEQDGRLNVEYACFCNDFLVTGWVIVTFMFLVMHIIYLFSKA